MTSIVSTTAAPPRGEPQKHAAIAVVERASGQVARLTSGAVLTGTVVGREGGGLLRVETENGTLILRTPMALPEGTPVRMQIQIVGNQMRAVILAAGAQPAVSVPDPSSAGAATGRATLPAPTGAAPLPAGRAGDVAVSLSVATPPATPIAPGAVVTARFVHALAAAASAGGVLSAPSSAGTGDGALVVIRIVDVAFAAGRAPPQASQGAGPGSAAPSGEGRGPQVLPPGAAAVSRTPLPPIAGQPMPVRPNPAYRGPGAGATAHPTAPPAPQPPPQPGHVLLGTVVLLPGAPAPVLSSPLGPLTFEGIAALPAGSTVRFEVVGRNAAAGAARGPLAPVAGELAQRWPTFGDLLDALHEIDPRTAAGLADGLVPRPGPRLAYTVLLFLSALRLGNIEAWLGADTADRLRAAGKARTLAAAGDEFGRFSHRAAEHGTADWRAFVIPFNDGGRFEPLHLFHRRQRDAEGGPSEAGTDRFLIDLRLSRLGRMQLDGLVRQKSFRLIVRSADPLTGDARSAIAEIFESGCACAGLTGEIAFAGAREFVALPGEGPDAPLPSRELSV